MTEEEVQEVFNKQANVLKYIGAFKDIKDIYANAPKEIGNIANTCNISLCFDGHKWVVITYSAICRFKILDRGYIAGRGYYTVVDNTDNIPIITKHKILYQDRELDIKSVEYVMLMMEPPFPDNKWTLITNEEIKGDELFIQLYKEPEKVDKQKEDNH